VDVLLVEDDTAMREHLERAIRDHPGLRLVGSHGDVGSAMKALDAAPPRVLVTDLGLPDGSGLELIRALRLRAKDSLALVVTVMGDEETVVQAIRHGASGYLLKDEPVDEIGASILAMVEGGAPISPAIARYLMTRLRDEAATESHETPEAPTIHLSGREREVLSLVAKGFRFPEIAELLELSTHTVTTYVRRIYAKLEVGSKGEAVYEALHLGLIDLDD